MALAPLGLGVPTLPTGRLAAFTATAAGPACCRATAVALHLRRAVLGGPAVGQLGRPVVNSLGAQRRCRFTSRGGGLSASGLLLRRRRQTQDTTQRAA